MKTDYLKGYKASLHPQESSVWTVKVFRQSAHVFKNFQLQFEVFLNSKYATLGSWNIILFKHVDLINQKLAKNAKYSLLLASPM